MNITSYMLTYFYCCRFSNCGCKRKQYFNLSLRVCLVGQNLKVFLGTFFRNLLGKENPKEMKKQVVQAT